MGIHRSRFIFPAAAILLFSGVGTTQEPALPEPTRVVGSAADTISVALDGKQAYYAENLAELYALVDGVMQGRFDIGYASKQVLGKKHWTAASPAQREQFEVAFYNFLVKTYAKTVLDFRQDAMEIQAEPKYSKDRKKALVLTSIKLEAGDPAQVDYALRTTSDGWLIYDVRVDGVSYLQNYRSQFDAEINAEGLDSVIERLNAGTEIVLEEA